MKELSDLTYSPLRFVFSAPHQLRSSSIQIQSSRLQNRSNTYLLKYRVSMFLHPGSATRSNETLHRDLLPISTEKHF